LVKPFIPNGMKETPDHIEKMAKLSFASVYPHYVSKIERKGRSIDELHEVIKWLTGFNADDLNKLIEEQALFSTFFERASLHPNAPLIKGLICGYRIEEIEDPLTKKVRYLDKLVDELAKGKPIEKILR
jgi:hypothetical protein